MKRGYSTRNNYLHCFIAQNNFYCIQNSTFIWKKVCTIVYKVYTNGYFDLTPVDKLQRCLDFSVYKFLLWFDLKKCRQSATMICRQKEMYTKVDTPIHSFKLITIHFLLKNSISSCCHKRPILYCQLCYWKYCGKNPNAEIICLS